MRIKFYAIGIFVNSLKSMIEFYRDVLGVEIEWDGNGPHAEFKHEGIRFMVYERNEPWGMRSSFVADPEGNLIEIGSWGKGESK